MRAVDYGTGNRNPLLLPPDISERLVLHLLLKAQSLRTFWK